MDRIIFKESAHYYDHLGNPIDCVPYAKPRREGLCPACGNVTWTDVKKDKGTCKFCKAKIYVGDFEPVKGKEPGLLDAKKYGLFPSVSRMCSYGEMEFTLSAWAKNELIKWVMDNYKEDREVWMRTVQRGIGDFENRFADTGSYVHGQIAKAMEGQPWNQEDKTVLRAVTEVMDWVGKNVTSPESERGHCDPMFGVGGCIDLNSDGITADFKCKFNPKTFDELKAGRSRHYLESAIKQLACYRYISGRHDNRCFVIPIRVDENHPDSGEICPIELTKDELDWGLAAIEANVNAWMVNKKHNPREMFLEDQCWSRDEILKGSRN